MECQCCTWQSWFVGALRATICKGFNLLIVQSLDLDVVKNGLKYGQEYATRKLQKRARLLRNALKLTGDWRCHLCGGELTLETATIDHIKPKIMGGKYSGNLKLAHKECNTQRGIEPVHYHKMRVYLEASYPNLKARSDERISRYSRPARSDDAASER
jgi:5-methylcytosine-specific restriction endonuclease McrA